jgi:hypothetical protein
VRSAGTIFYYGPALACCASTPTRDADAAGEATLWAFSSGGCEAVGGMAVERAEDRRVWGIQPLQSGTAVFTSSRLSSR